MANGDESSPPQTLADLWLKSKPVRASPSASGNQPESPIDSDSTAPQMDLLFALPPSPTEAPTPPKPRTTRSRRKPSEAAGTDDPQPEFRRRSAVANPPAPPPPHAAERRVWTVRDIVTGIRQQLEGEYQDIWVEGEISNCRPAPSGHLYFTLKDGDAQLPVVLFRRQTLLLRFRPQDGLAVLVRGRISIYESRGQLQLIAETLEPRGAGALQLAFEQLKARLLAEGLFDASRKRALPGFPRCIGVITSTGGAVLHDIIKVVRRRHARLDLLVYPATVQGPGCAASIAAGIRWFNAHPDRADLILIARGGGSLEDLAGFNDEALARAIAASALPTVSAVGHETDFTIADFVADLRAPTPSAGAELITTAQHRVEERVQALDARVLRAIRYQFMLARQRFTALSIDSLRNRLQTLIGRRSQRLDDLRQRATSAAMRRLRTPSDQLRTLTARLDRHNPSIRLSLSRRRMESAEQALARIALAVIAARGTRVGHATAQLYALSPVAVLNRGYALVYASGGQLLRNATDTQPGQSIRARLAQGTLEAEVTRTED